MHNINLTLKNLWVNTFVTDENKVYFVSAWYNVLFCMDMETQTVNETYNITQDSVLSNNHVFYMYKKDKNIYIVLGKPNATILKFDIDEKKIEYVCDLTINGNWGDNADEDEEYVYIPIINQKKIAIMSKEDYTFEYKDLPIEEKGISTVCKEDNKFYAVTVGTANVIELNAEMEVVNILENKPKNYNLINTNYPSSGIFYIDGHVIVFSRYSNMNVLYDTYNSDVLQFEDGFENYDFNIGPIITSTRKNKDGIVIYRNDLDEWFFYDMNMKCVKRQKLCISKQSVEYLENAKLFDENSAYFETEKKEIHTLNNFIFSLVNS